MSKRKGAKKSDKSTYTPKPPPTTPNNNDTETIKTELEVDEVQKSDIRKITITLESYQNIMPAFSISDIRAQCQYRDKYLNETLPIPITDDKDLEINQTFDIEIDVNNPKDLDLLISKPTVLLFNQYSGSFDPQLYEQLKESEETKKETNIKKSFDSIVSMYEAFVGEKVTLDESKKKKGKEKKKGAKEEKAKDRGKKKKGTSIKSSKISSDTKKSESKSKEEASLQKGQEKMEYGMCIIDFLPLFYGKTEFCQKLLIKPITLKKSEIISTFKNHPSVSISVSLNPSKLIDVSNILFFTVESIYNIPSLMSSDKDYKICCVLPMHNNSKYPILIGNAQYTTDPPREDIYKSWPNVPIVGDQANVTMHKINTSFDDIKNKVGSEIDDTLRGSGSRLEFNCVKRNILMRDGLSSFISQVQTFRKVPIEIYMTTKVKGQTAEDLADQSKIKRNVPFLHLMGIVDISSLLYPGITKVRVACPLSTFSPEEALKFAGLDDSFFVPKTKHDSLSVDNKSEGGAKKTKKEKPEKGSKKSSKKDKTDDKDLKSQLPPKLEPLPEPEPSVPVLNDEGQPCFILIEIELLNPINEKQTLDDIIVEFDDIRSKYSDATKIVLTNCITKNYFKDAISKIAESLNKLYPKYLDEKTENLEFTTYLERTGEYQKYISSITEATTLIVRNKFKIDEQDLQNNKKYCNFIGEVFNYLISEMNEVLNTLVCNGLVPATEQTVRKWDDSYFYAKEAAELRRYEVADRYFLERICNVDNAGAWFDYAVYNMEIEENSKALECVKIALEKNSAHRYSMLLFAILTDNQNKKDESETCFLSLMVQEPRWLEGWGVLYLFYQKYDKYEGMEVAMDMAKKYCDDERNTSDYISENDDLAWFSEIVPHTIFFKSAILLIKFRAYNWAEMALAQEVNQPNHYGIVNYLVATIFYYQKKYDHALEHIEETKEYYGSDYAVGSLQGHILLALEKYTEASEEYYHVLESFNRPQNIHLVYVNSCLCLEQLGRDQEARKCMLLACKFNPSAFSWFKAALLYNKENDFLSAEECLTEANIRDNRDPDVWAYLCLVNLKLSRVEEAELCYQQALKNNLSSDLANEIQNEFKKNKIDNCL